MGHIIVFSLEKKRLEKILDMREDVCIKETETDTERHDKQRISEWESVDGFLRLIPVLYTEVYPNSWC